MLRLLYHVLCPWGFAGFGGSCLGFLALVSCVFCGVAAGFSLLLLFVLCVGVLVALWTPFLVKKERKRLYIEFQSCVGNFSSIPYSTHITAKQKKKKKKERIRSKCIGNLC